MIPGAVLRSVVHAADSWLSVELHCCLQAQHFAGAGRSSNRLRS